MSWKDIKPLSHRAAARYFFSDRLSAAGVCRAAARLNEQGTIKIPFIAVSFRDGRLKIAVTSYDDLVAIRWQAEHFLAALNDELGENVVDSLQVTVSSPNSETADPLP